MEYQLRHRLRVAAKTALAISVAIAFLIGAQRITLISSADPEKDYVLSLPGNFKAASRGDLPSLVIYKLSADEHIVTDYRDFDLLRDSEPQSATLLGKSIEVMSEYKFKFDGKWYDTRLGHTSYYLGMNPQRLHPATALLIVSQRDQ